MVWVDASKEKKNQKHDGELKTKQIRNEKKLTVSKFGSFVRVDGQTADRYTVLNTSHFMQKNAFANTDNIM